MNILFISHNLYPCKTGGAEIFNYYLIKALSKFCKVIILTLCKTDTGLDLKVIRERRRKYGFARISVPIQDMSAILKLRNEIDLIHITYMRAHWLEWIPYPVLKGVLGIPYIITIHGGGMHEWKPAFPHKYLFKNASEIIGVSMRIKNEYEKRTNREVTYIPPLIPFKKCTKDKLELRRKYHFNASDTILLFLGSVKKIKGCDTLINAFIGLGEDYIKRNQLRLLMAGDGNLRSELEEIVRKNNLTSHIRFLGNVSHDHVPAIFAISDLYVLPSQFEGTPISMLEAMFNGMPIIAANVGGINNIIEHEKNGLLFEANNPDDLKTKILKLFENKESARKLAMKASNDYQNIYNFNEVVVQYSNIYERIVSLSKI